MILRMYAVDCHYQPAPVTNEDAEMRRDQRAQSSPSRSESICDITGGEFPFLLEHSRVASFSRIAVYANTGTPPGTESAVSRIEL